MTALIGTLLSDWWPQIVAGFAAAAAALGLYVKGRSDQKSKTELKDLRDANEIRRDGAAARADAAAGRLRDSDGFKRD
jgi:ABC-type sugar transport system substrate-binding protein